MYLVGELLEFVGDEVVVVPEYVVVGGSTGALDAGVGAEVEVELGRVSDTHVHRRPRRDVVRLAHLTNSTSCDKVTLKLIPILP